MTRVLLRYWLYFFLGITFVLCKTSVLAAPKNSSVQAAQLVERLLLPKKQSLDSKLEERAKQILSAQLETGSYLVTVTTKLDTAKISAGIARSRNLDLSTLSRKMTDDEVAEKFVDIQTSETLFALLKKTTIRLALDKEVPESIEKIVTRALKESLGLVEGRDEIAITREKLGGISSSRQQEKISNLEQEKNRIFEEKRSLEIKTGSLESQRLQYEELLRQARAETERARDELKQSKQRSEEEIKKYKEQISDLERNALGENTFLGKVRKYIRGFELLVTFVPIAILGVLVLLVISVRNSSSNQRRSAAVFQGMQVLATALQKSGNPLGAQNPLNALTTPRPQVTNENQQAFDASQAMVGDAALELVRSEAAEAWKVMSENPFAMLSILKDWTLTSEGATRFMAFSDAVGIANTQLVWAGLSSSDIENAARLAGDPLPKATALALVSQVLRQAAAFRASRPRFLDSFDLSFLLKVSDDELASHLSGLPADAIAFTLLCSTPERVGRLLAKLKINGQDVVARIGALGQANEQAVQSLVDSLSQRIVPNANGQGSLAGVLLSIFENAPLESRQAIAEGLKGHPQFASQIGNRIVTMSDVLRLDRSTLAELLDPLTPAQLAEIVFTLPQNQQGAVAGVLSQKMMFDVQQELSRFREKPSAARKATVSGRALQSMLCESVRAQVEQGLIELSQNAPSAKKVS